MARMVFLLLGLRSFLALCDAESQDLHTDKGPSQNVSPHSILDQDFKYIKLLTDAEGLYKFKQASPVGALFFYKKNLPQLDMFFSEFDKTAGFLEAYGIVLGLVDCTAQAEIFSADCKKADGETVFTYRFDDSLECDSDSESVTLPTMSRHLDGMLDRWHGTELLDLELDTMFDVNSMMSNILQLALLNEVMIVQSKRNRQIVEEENTGKMDIIYAYHSAIGTYEHRVFMEIAYAYRDKYKFMLGTEPASADGLQDADTITSRTTSAMWVLYCQDRSDAASGCRSVNYRGEFNLFALARFLQALSQPRVFYYPVDGQSPPCELDDSVGCVYIEYPAAATEEAKLIIDSLQFDVHGFAGVVVKELAPEAAASSELGQKPLVSVTSPSKKEEKVMMDPNWDFTLQNVEAFIRSVLFSEPVSMDRGTEPGQSIEDAEEDYTSGVDEIDDMVLNVAYQERENSGSIEHVPALTDKTFPVATANSKLLVVLFYLPFDARSRVSSLHYEKAAAELAALKGDDPDAHPLAQVNCFDWTDVCQKANITTFPQIHVYRSGGERQQYMRALDKDILVQTVRLLQLEQPLRLKSKEEVEDFMGGLLPVGADKMTDNIVLMKASKANTELQVFEEVVKTFESEMMFAVVESHLDTPLMPEGGVIHVRLTDSHQPIETLTSDLSIESITALLHKGQFHLLPELTHENFPALYARKQPFGIVFTQGSDAEARLAQQVVADVAKSKKFPDLIFCKMTISGKESLANSVYHKYTDSMSLPTFAIVQHTEGQVFVLQEVDFTKDVLTNWIQEVLGGKLPPTRILEKGEWKPAGPHYDFLRMIEKEQEQKQALQTKTYTPEKSMEISEAGSQKLKEVEELDADIRANLLELQNSRLYHSRERRAHQAHHAAGQADKAGLGKASHADATGAEGKARHVPHTEL